MTDWPGLRDAWDDLCEAVGDMGRALVRKPRRPVPHHPATYYLRPLTPDEMAGPITLGPGENLCRSPSGQILRSGPLSAVTVAPGAVSINPLDGWNNDLGKVVHTSDKVGHWAIDPDGKPTYLWFTPPPVERG